MRAGIFDSRHENGVLERERERLVSRFTGDPTIENFRSMKESCSKRRGLRVGFGFEEFRQTP